MVLYVSACHSGSMFSDYDTRYRRINVYIMTSCLPDEVSSKVMKSDEQNTHFSTQFGVAWTKDSDKYNRSKRTLQQQYHKVKFSLASPRKPSTAMQYGQKIF
ncbi:legumain-like [Helianthus annuus]|uniref:legumain-like n=1 Tax=Helianthus annuus TaxID=4232 RepID=UPI000B902EDC|nr:legumain-like [Helianthus annuus]